MTIYNFKEFSTSLLFESLHPELKEIIKSKKSKVSKQTKIANKVKELSSRGEKTGIEGNMPKGSSRAYLPHEEHQDVMIDGKPEKIKTGVKVAIRSTLDKHHNFHEHDNLSLGQLQNQHENGDHYINKEYRILTEDPNKNGHYHTNEENGIFPPLLDHDHENHNWSHVGHVSNITKENFKKLTKTESHPRGITHKDFVDSLNRVHNKSNGRYWEATPQTEKRLDKTESHPLVQKFIHYHLNYGSSPSDYAQIKNMGVWHHPNGSKHIVARDHGFSPEVEKAYAHARKVKSNPFAAFR